MNKTKLYRRYARIDSIEQLRRERYKLNSMIEVRELELMHDYYSVKDMFTLSNLLDAVAARFTNLGPIVNGAIDGFLLIKSLFKGKKSRRKHGCM